MADLSNEQIQRLARLGAKARLEELRREEAAIRQAFPDLSGGRASGAGGRKSGAGPAPAAAPRTKRRMTAAARKAVSDRMRKYWAERRKAKSK
ncbi:MAG TPA: hypothetical protein VG222_03110 [Vicinamibacterales bacterium]|nr:hypothetical protein [Vicinamibacterales bacterium]